MSSTMRTKKVLIIDESCILMCVDPDGPLVPRSPPEEEENVKMVEGSEMNWNALESAVSSAVDQRSRWDRDSSSSDKEERSESEGKRISYDNT